jgi:hypothetical protein
MSIPRMLFPSIAAVLLFCLTCPLFPQTGASYHDQEYFYSVTLPPDWEWKKIDNPQTIIRLAASSKKNSNSFTVLAVKSTGQKLILDQFAGILDADPNMKQIMGDCLSERSVKRYGQKIIEKNYINKLLPIISCQTYEFIVKNKHGIIFIFESKDLDARWQDEIRNSIVFHFPMSGTVKTWRIIALGAALIFLFYGISASSAPFTNGSRFAKGFISIFLLFKSWKENSSQRQKNKHKSGELERKNDALKSLKQNVDPQFNRYWELIKNYIRIS